MPFISTSPSHASIIPTDNALWSVPFLCNVRVPDFQIRQLSALALTSFRLRLFASPVKKRLKSFSCCQLTPFSFTALPSLKLFCPMLAACLCSHSLSMLPPQSQPWFHWLSTKRESSASPHVERPTTRPYMMTKPTSMPHFKRRGIRACSGLWQQANKTAKIAFNDSIFSTRVSLYPTTFYPLIAPALACIVHNHVSDPAANHAYRGVGARKHQGEKLKPASKYDMVEEGRVCNERDAHRNVKRAESIQKEDSWLVGCWRHAVQRRQEQD